MTYDWSSLKRLENGRLIHISACKIACNLSLVKANESLITVFAMLPIKCEIISVVEMSPVSNRYERYVAQLQMQSVLVMIRRVD